MTAGVELRTGAYPQRCRGSPGRTLMPAAAAPHPSERIGVSRDQRVLLLHGRHDNDCAASPSGPATKGARRAHTHGPRAVNTYDAARSPSDHEHRAIPRSTSSAWRLNTAGRSVGPRRQTEAFATFFPSDFPHAGSAPLKPCKPSFLGNRSVVGAGARISLLVQRILRVWIVRRRRRSTTPAGRRVLRSCLSWLGG